MRVSELLATLRTPSYIARVAVHRPRHVVEAKRCLKKAFAYQAAGRCFTLVEFLSTCPTNWGLTPTDSLHWLERNMLDYYPLGEFKSPEEA
jgi:2-oxoglutarate ferredoxin oxidoreductase subunit beta